MQPPNLCRDLGMHVHGDVALGRLIAPALRRNPRRAHLLVSTVLGKHIPAEPAAVRSAADHLTDLVALELHGEPCVVFGFAETATGLGHCVAARLDAAVYLQSTRRTGATVYGEFTEGHSHATSHLLQPSSPDLLSAADVLVLVDDEISTGATALDSIRALHALAPHRRYVVASLVDVRSPARAAENTRAAADSGLDIVFVALAHGTVDLPDGLPERVAGLPATPFNPVAGRRGTVEVLSAPWPSDVPDGGRHGVLAADQSRLRDAAAEVAAELAPHLDGRPVIVIGHEELMYLPLCVAESLAADGHRVRFQTTTRSPALVRDEDGYPLRRGFEFLSPEPDPEAPRRYLYNAQWAGEEARIVLIVDSPADTDRLRAPGGLLDVLAAAGHDVLVAIVPASDQSELAAARAEAAQQ
ncbi:phosphoribosyltransferase family protein [Tsukamurella sp. NPDC003166]|uniref:phosphoribosyltransferase family protein n=1 Tax=Tsukamurella sp. NPDC003166 TaxID=3154444 RepID=UPI0033AE4FD6